MSEDFSALEMVEVIKRASKGSSMNKLLQESYQVISSNLLVPYLDVHSFNLIKSVNPSIVSCDDLNDDEFIFISGIDLYPSSLTDILSVKNVENMHNNIRISLSKNIKDALIQEFTDSYLSKFVHQNSIIRFANVSYKNELFAIRIKNTKAYLSGYRKLSEYVVDFEFSSSFEKALIFNDLDEFDWISEYLSNYFEHKTSFTFDFEPFGKAEIDEERTLARMRRNQK